MPGRILSIGVHFKSPKWMILCAASNVSFFSCPWGIAVVLAPGALLVGAITITIKLAVLAIVVAVLETSVAKLRLFRVPELLAGSFMMALLAVVSFFFLR